MVCFVFKLPKFDYDPKHIIWSLNKYQMTYIYIKANQTYEKTVYWLFYIPKQYASIFYSIEKLVSLCMSRQLKRKLLSVQYWKKRMSRYWFMCQHSPTVLFNYSGRTWKWVVESHVGGWATVKQCYHINTPALLTPGSGFLRSGPESQRGLIYSKWDGWTCLSHISPSFFSFPRLHPCHAYTRFLL